MLEVKNVSKFFKGLVALDDVTFTVEKDTIQGIIGPNGAGKSTLFNCITCFYPASKGEVIFEGRKISKVKPHKITELGITRTFQHTQVFPELTVRNNILTGQNVIRRKDRKRSKEELQAKIDEIIAFVGLESLEDSLGKNLSLGQQTKLAIAISLATEPKMLLLDEPAAGMNPEETNQLVDLLRKIKKMGVTIVLIEHDMKAVMGLCERIVVLEYGKKIAEGSPEEIRNNPKVIEAYLGSEELA